MNRFIRQNITEESEENKNELPLYHALGNIENNNDCRNNSERNEESTMKIYDIEHERNEEFKMHLPEEINPMQREADDPFVNIKFTQNGQYKRMLDICNDNNTFEQYLKKLKTCCIDPGEVRTYLEKRFPYGCETATGGMSVVTEEENKALSYESNSSSSNLDNIYCHKRRLNVVSRSRSKAKNKSKKRKRIVAKIDKQFILRCTKCKFINPNELKIEDYYVCQNCGDNDFSVMVSNPSNNMNTNIE